MDLIEPKEVQIADIAGSEKTYYISKIPCIPAREIVTQYPVTAMPKIGEYKLNEALMLRLMTYVEAVASDGSRIRLSSPALVNNHVTDYEALARLEAAMFEYNTSFFGKGKNFISSGSFAKKAAGLISQILTALSEQSSQKAKPPSTN